MIKVLFFGPVADRVLIWKKEITPQGDSWVTPHP